MKFPIYYVRPRNLFFIVFGLVFLFLCLLEWLDKKRITRADLRLNIVVSLVSVAFIAVRHLVRAAMNPRFDCH
jgi:hypothetical protein